MLKRSFSLLLAALLCGNLWAAEPAADERAVAEALAIYLKAAAGERAANQPAVAQFQALKQSDPARSLLYSGYLASLEVMQGRDAFWPWEKLNLTEKGLDGLEKLVRQLTPAHDQVLLRGVPISLELRALAARTFLAVPDFFHRETVARQTLKTILASPLLEAAPVLLRAEVRLAQATLAERDKRLDEARLALRDVVQWVPGTPTAKTAAQRLAELGK